ncbi:hypothetical protein ANN_12303 [Periplaneta americana]|uniref:Ionotropic glutamate receptor C-terminal domain-containing protein n=1 Tax=Periplaneta americana TaxID=6978 RepID=A0ABQ8TI42_PERAM|nr:hypothetical protein ANN_12303 [Periplaneta americana]
MVRSGVVLVIVILFTHAASVESEDSARLHSIASLVAAFKRYFHLKCVFLITITGHEELSMMLKITRLLAQDGVFNAVVEARVFNNTLEEFMCHGSRPLNVVLSTNNSSLQQISSFTGPVWLMFTSSVPCLAGVYIPINAELILVNTTLSGIQILTEAYHTQPDSSLVLNPVGEWSDADGLSMTNDSLLRRRGNLHGNVFKAATNDNKPMTHLGGNETSPDVGGYIGEIWHLLEKDLNFSTAFEMAEAGVDPKKSGGKWKAMIRKVAAGTVDFAVDAFTMNPQRTSQIAFLTPVIITSSFRGEGYIQCCVGVRLCDMYSNQELAEIHFMYGKADGKAALARRLYQERYPQRQCPDRKTFVRLLYRLCEYGKFNSPGLGKGRPRSTTPEVQTGGDSGGCEHDSFYQHTKGSVTKDTPLINRQHIHFLHDGAPAHFSRTARRYLDRRFPDRWIGRGGPIAWPPRSPDLNPLDFYLWGHLKSLVYSSPVPDLESLPYRIVACSEDIRNTPGVWDRVRRSMGHRSELNVVNRHDVFIRRSDRQTVGWGKFLSPFSGGTWATTVAAMLLSTLTLYAAQSFMGGSDQSSVQLYLLCVYGIFCQKGSVKLTYGTDNTPNFLSGRLAFAVASLTSVVVYTAYSAILMSYLAVHIDRLPFYDLKGLLEDGSYQLGTLRGSSAHVYFEYKNLSVKSTHSLGLLFLSQTTNNSFARELYDKTMAPNVEENFLPNRLNGLRRTCDTKYGYITTKESAVMMKDDLACEVVALPDENNVLSMSMITGRKSPYLELITHR